MRRHEGARRQRRVPGEGVLGIAFRHIDLTEDIPGNPLHAFVGPGDAGDLAFHAASFPELWCAVLGVAVAVILKYLLDDLGLEFAVRTIRHYSVIELLARIDVRVAFGAHAPPC